VPVPGSVLDDLAALADDLGLPNPRRRGPGGH
jgi:hypothetical protein